MYKAAFLVTFTFAISASVCAQSIDLDPESETSPNEKPASASPVKKITQNKALATDPSLDISRLSYFPHRNIFLANTRLTYPLANTSDAIATKARIQVETKTATDSVSFESGLSYGINDWLRFVAKESFLMTSGSFSNIPPGTTYSETYSQGPSDPSFSLGARLLDPHTLGFSSDIFFWVSPSTSTHFSGKPGQLGDNYRGFSSTSVYLPIYWSQRANDIELALSYTQTQAGESIGSTPASSFTKSVNSFSTITVSDRLHFSKFYLQLGADITLPYQTEQITEAPTAIKKTFNFPSIVTQKYVAGFRINSNASIDAEFTYNNFILNMNTDEGTSSVSEQINSFFSLHLMIEI